MTMNCKLSRNKKKIEACDACSLFLWVCFCQSLLALSCLFEKLIVEELRVVFAPEENQPDIVHTLSTPQGVAKMTAEGITIKEGSRYKIRISFRVQHEIIAGIKFTNLVSRLMVSDKDDLMIGSYPPSSTPHVFEFPKWDYNEAPKGMLLRGKYKVINTFVDSDKVEHLKYDYELQIVKK